MSYCGSGHWPRPENITKGYSALTAHPGRVTTTHWLLSQRQYIFLSVDAFIAKQHISFEVDTLEKVITSLKELGVTDFEVGRVNLFKHKNYKWCEWRDPSGIRIECVEVL